MVNPAPALVAAFIWAFSPIYYRDFLRRFDPLSFNLLRTVTAAGVLALPAALSWNSEGLSYAVLSGTITLACGDSMFLLSIRETGASVAAPVVYTYVLMVQAVGFALGQSVPYANFLAAAAVVIGVYILSRGGEGKPRAKGIWFALAAGVLWTAGQELIQASTSAGGSLLSVTFTRNFAGAVALGAAFLLTNRAAMWPRGVSPREYAVMLFFIVSDLVAGSLLFVYSISTTGVALTVILTSLSPLLTQLFAKALGKESPSGRDLVGGALIVAAVVFAVAF